MASQIIYPVDDKDIDDTALWAVIDSAAASHSLTSAKSRKSSSLSYSTLKSPSTISNASSPLPKYQTNSRNIYSDNGCGISSPGGEVHRSHKMARYCISKVGERSPLTVVKHVQQTPSMAVISSPEMERFPVTKVCNMPDNSPCSWSEVGEKMNTRHSFPDRLPSVSLFKEYQRAAIEILDKTDYAMISGKPYIKKSGWRKISFYFNLSFEIKDRTIEFDENRNVQRAEFIVRAYMQGGRFCDGWGSCELREKRFTRPNHDVPATAETRAKNRACQDLLGIGECRPGSTSGPR